MGLVDRELLQFNSFVKLLHRVLRWLNEAIILKSFLQNKCKRKAAELQEVGSRLPFLGDYNTGMAILMKLYLEKRLAGKSTLVAEAELQQNVPGCEDVRAELRRGFAFWNQVVAAVKILAAEKPKIASQFASADSWVATMKP